MGEGKGKNSSKQRGRQIHKRLLNTEKKLRVDRGGGAGERGKWVMGFEESICWEKQHLLGDGCCMRAMNHGNLLPKPKANCIHCMLANLTINYIKKTPGKIVKNNTNFSLSTFLIHRLLSFKCILYKNIILFYFSLVYFLKFTYFLRERWREHEPGRGREREGERGSQGVSALSAQSPTQGSNSQTERS